MLKYLLVFNLILVASSLPISGLPRMSIDLSASIFESILDQVKSTFTITGPWARFGQEYFVQWNDDKWIECEIEKALCLKIPEKFLTFIVASRNFFAP